MKWADREFSMRVKIARKKLGISQRELAEKCFMTRATVMHIELFQQRIFLDQALDLAAFLKIPLEDMK
jgi:transcriptional regulator with XRE-family HTH domain